MIIRKTQTATLDGILNNFGYPSCDLIKIDVEGHELHVIQGGFETIERFEPAILIEIIKKENLKKIKNFEKTKKIEISVSRQYHLALDPLNQEIFKHRNFLFIKREAHKNIISNHHCSE